MCLSVIRRVCGPYTPFVSSRRHTKRICNRLRLPAQRGRQSLTRTTHSCKIDAQY